ncbi:hypothetical protein AXE94_09765 [Staphylococcus aureus]|nr:hypothetical protein [Staphylococcus aureus]
MAMFKRRKNNKKQDLILLRQEALEHYLMNKYNYYYREAHGIVERKCNFSNYIEK